MVYLPAVTWMTKKKKKEPDIAFFIKYWNRDYLVNAVFFSRALMGNDLYACDSYSSILQRVCVSVYILNKNAVPLLMSWASGKLTRAPLTLGITQQAMKGHVKHGDLTIRKQISMTTYSCFPLSCSLWCSYMSFM